MHAEVLGHLNGHMVFPYDWSDIGYSKGGMHLRGGKPYKIKYTVDKENNLLGEEITRRVNGMKAHYRELEHK